MFMCDLSSHIFHPHKEIVKKNWHEYVSNTSKADPLP